jgi:acetylornithine deacetylase/succinyl-diaminopimelate desuccinylase-like protein
MSKWRYPSFTIHKIDVSGPDNVTIIPCKAKASVSMRIVPDQDIDDIVKSFNEFVKEIFSELRTKNNIHVSNYSTLFILPRMDNVGTHEYLLFKTKKTIYHLVDRNQ